MYSQQIIDESEETTRQIALQLPKAQLHVHLDGSLTEAFIAERAKFLNIPLPCQVAQLRRHLLTEKFHAQQTHSYTQAQGGNWTVFNFCNRFLQTAEALHSAAAAVTHTLVAQNTVIIELRFCPTLHTHQGLTPDAAVAAVVSGLSSALPLPPAPQAIGGVIVVALRSFPSSHVSEMLQLASRWMQHGVIGADLAGDEATYPLTIHADVLATAQTLQVPLTIHAGEWGPSAHQNLRLAVDLGVKRIGHALTLHSDPVLCKKVVDSQIPIEVCLTSNCSGPSKVPADKFSLHPLPKLLASGVPVAGLNCDNLLLSGTLLSRPSPTEEIVRARRGCKLSWEQIAKVLITGAGSTFVPFENDKAKSQFVESFTSKIEDVLRNSNFATGLRER